MHTQKIRQKAIELRKAGYSYNYIMNHVPVAKSTLSDWLYDIPFTPNKHTQETIGNARLASGVYRNNLKNQLNQLFYFVSKLFGQKVYLSTKFRKNFDKTLQK